MKNSGIGANLIKLESVGSCVDVDIHEVYAVTENGIVDWSSAVHIYNVSDEWFNSLSEYDLQKLINYKVYEIMQ